MENRNLSQHIETFLKELSKNGISVEEVAQCSGISIHSLSNWRNGYSKPNHKNLTKLREYALNVWSSNKESLYYKDEYRELREVVQTFYNQIDKILMNMSSTGETEKKILDDHKNNSQAQEMLEKFLDFGVFDMYVNFDNQDITKMSEKVDINKKIKKKYQKTFIENINNLIEFIDETTQYEVDTLCESHLFPDKLVKRQVKEFYNNIPHEEDFDVPYKISSIGEQWIQTNLGISKTQVKNWRIGKDRPSEENLEILKKLVRRKGKSAFLGYTFLNEDFVNMFLPSLDIEAEDEEGEIALHCTLEYFTNVLFYYCYYNENVKNLINDVQENTIKQTDISIASSFFNEMHSLRVSRKYFYDEKGKQDMPNLKEYFDMSNESVDYVLKKDQRILDKIVTDENIKLLLDYADTNFDNDKKEALTEVIRKVKKNEGIRPLILVTNVKFLKLYHPNKEK
ncbi:helix-turn-helix domain-containing protein [Staphylococcus epidermidis]|uniref:helix-turn-helix domain-containing protein n=1 Tax=Staphylococcus epidermidis TaxID=1282 RepID=UPI00066EDBAC|nr:helix-turn-helix transcriptional regulator [Staphylococcus epidermidis]MCO6228573.1 helix-turn-helix domain-containing protein [Staphylococcus epidermidis]MCO6241938.1 helix-turn-helix domain-containing protein [Staphylococcus epidermidis]